MQKIKIGKHIVMSIVQVLTHMGICTVYPLYRINAKGLKISLKEEYGCK